MPGRFSQSALAAFSRCERRYYLQYVRRLEWPAPVTGSEQDWERSRLRGERLHLLIQQRALGLEVDAVARASGDPELVRWWDRFLREPPPMPAGRVHTELEVEVDLPSGDRLVARFDRLVVEPVQPPRLHILDWKTGKVAGAADLACSWQTTVYRFAATAGSQRLTAGRGRVAPEDVRFTYWQTAAPEAPVTLTYDAEQHDRAGARIAAAVGQIAARGAQGEEAFARTPDSEACRHCPYRSYCDRGREAAPGIDPDDPDDEVLWDPPGDPEE